MAAGIAAEAGKMVRIGAKVRDAGADNALSFLHEIGEPLWRRIGLHVDNRSHPLCNDILAPAHLPLVDPVRMFF